MGRRVHEFPVALPCLCSVTGYNPFRNSCHLRGQANFVKCDIRQPNSCMADIFYNRCFNSNSATKVMTWAQMFSIEYMSVWFPWPVIAFRTTWVIVLWLTYEEIMYCDLQHRNNDQIILEEADYTCVPYFLLCISNLRVWVKNIRFQHEQCRRCRLFI